MCFKQHLKAEKSYKLIKEFQTWWQWHNLQIYMPGTFKFCANFVSSHYFKALLYEYKQLFK